MLGFLACLQWWWWWAIANWKSRRRSPAVARSGRPGEDLDPWLRSSLGSIDWLAERRSRRCSAMVLQNGDAGRSISGTITPEAYSAETVSIQQEPRRKPTPRPVLDSYYIEFPSLGESYSLPRKDVDADEPLPSPPSVSPCRCEKRDVLPTNALHQQLQKSSVMRDASATTTAAVLGLRRGQPRSAGSKEVIATSTEHCSSGGGSRRTASSVSHRRPNQPPPHGRSSAGSRAVSGGAQPKPHRSKQPLAVPAADMPRPTSALFSSAVAVLKSSVPFTGRPAAAPSESPLARMSPGSLARLVSKPWKELEDCGVACFPLPAADAACRPLSELPAHCANGRDGVAVTEKIAVTDTPAVTSACCDEPEHCFSNSVGTAVAETTVAFAAVGWTGLDSQASLGVDTDGSSDHCGRTCGADALYSEVATICGSIPVCHAAGRPKPCRCHLSWYNGECDCAAMRSIDRIAPEDSDDDDDVDCWALCHHGAADERDIQSFRNDGFLQTCESGQEVSGPILPPDGCDDIWAAAASRLMGTFVHPDRSESIATAVLQGCTTATFESAATTPAAPDTDDHCGSYGTISEWPSAAESGAACNHPCYHFEIFLDTDCNPFTTIEQRSRHCFDWTRYADRPTWSPDDGVDECDTTGSSLDCAGWPPPEPGDHCPVCGCDVHAWGRLPQDADFVTASLEQLLLQCLSLSPATVELQPAAAEGRIANDVETIADSAEMGCCVSSGTSRYGAV